MWANGSHLESTLPIHLLDQTARVELADVKIVGKNYHFKMVLYDKHMVLHMR